MSPENRMAGAADFYAAALLEEAPRVLGLMDREDSSPTAGCCDRTFWAWKFVDFPRSRFQEALCYLSFLYSSPLPGSPYHRNPRLLDWIAMGFEFWASVQHGNGSFDEAYPFERSLAATAFTSFYVGEALEFLGPGVPAAARNRTVEAMVRAGKWLLRNDETHGFLSNHLAAAAAALLHIYRVSSDETFQRRSEYFVEKILRHQSGEGWYEEYDGADPGYQTHGSFYLSRCLELHPGSRLEDSLRRSLDFLAKFIHPDGSLGGEYASRNTQTYYPAAFEMLALRHPAAAWIADTMRPSLASGAAAALRGIDSYNYFPFLNNFVFAYRAVSKRQAEPSAASEPAPAAGLLWFPEAGLARVRRARYDAYVGTAKGGVVKVFDREKRKLVYSDCGYLGRLGNGMRIASQYQDRRRTVIVTEKSIEVRGEFFQMSRPTMTPVTFVAFRLFSLTAGRVAAVGRWLKNALAQVLIYRKRHAGISFHRQIEFGEDFVRVRDHLHGAGARRLQSLQWEPLFTTIHMGSSRYFIQQELEPVQDTSGAFIAEIQPDQVVAGTAVERIVRFGGKKP